MGGPSIQDALRAFLPPIRHDDPHQDFYAIYKREATEYDADYVKKYDEDLNTTLIFVRYPPFAPVTYLTCSRRRACSLPSARLLSSMSTHSSNPTRTTNQQPFSVRSSLPSTSLLFQAKPPPFHPPRKPLLVRSSPSHVSCTQAYLSRFSPHSSRC